MEEEKNRKEIKKNFWDCNFGLTKNCPLPLLEVSKMLLKTLALVLTLALAQAAIVNDAEPVNALLTSLPADIAPPVMPGDNSEAEAMLEQEANDIAKTTSTAAAEQATPFSLQDPMTASESRVQLEDAKILASSKPLLSEATVLLGVNSQNLPDAHHGHADPHPNPEHAVIDAAHHPVPFHDAVHEVDQGITATAQAVSYL
jgi:hypothetical protein